MMPGGARLSAARKTIEASRPRAASAELQLHNFTPQNSAFNSERSGGNDPRKLVAPRKDRTGSSSIRHQAGPCWKTERLIYKSSVCSSSVVDERESHLHGEDDDGELR